MPENNLVDGIEELMRVILPQLTVTRRYPDKRGDLVISRPVIIVTSANKSKHLRLAAEYYNVLLWLNRPSGSRFYSIEPETLFDLREPDSLNRLEQACRALIEDY